MAIDDKNSEEIWDTRSMIWAARALQRVAQKMEEEPAESDPLAYSGEYLAVPVLLALATEIALKALQCQEKNGPPQRSHDLLKLFNGLRASTQKQLEAKMPQITDPLLQITASSLGWPTVNPGIKETLSFHRKAFEDWRYVYENPEGSFYPAGLIKALAAIIEVHDEAAEKMRNI